jgi:hypothetical protein
MAGFELLNVGTRRAGAILFGCGGFVKYLIVPIAIWSDNPAPQWHKFAPQSLTLFNRLRP